MTTTSISELRKAHARTRAQLARAAVRYGKRALAGRGSGENGPPSDQEVALLRELLVAAAAMTAAAMEHRAAANWQPQRQPWAGVTGANPDPLSGLWWAAFRLDTAKAAGDQAAIIEAGKALQEEAIVVCERGSHRLRPGRQPVCGFHQPHHLRFEVDHIVALIDDGGHEVRNLQLLCPYCNRVKGTQGSPGFRMKMTELRAHNVGTGVMVDEREARVASREGERGNKARVLVSRFGGSAY